MIKITNALTRAPQLTVKDIVIVNGAERKPFDSWQGKVFEDGDLPQVSETYNREAGEIWNKYFEWLFKKGGEKGPLPARIAAQLKTLDDEKFPIVNVLLKGGKVRRLELLELLISRPDELEKEIGGIKLRELGGERNSEEEKAAEEGKTPGKKRRKANPLSKAFDYKELSGDSKLRSVIELLGVRICPYCGRAFTGAVRRKNGKLIRTDQLDHFLPKSKYPQLALSLWNLIPSCGACNNRKSDDCEDEILYPYAEEMGDACRFVTHPVSGFGYLLGEPSEGDFEISLEAKDGDSDIAKKAKAEAELFGTKELYQQHKAYVRDIFRQRYVFGDPYIDDLITTFPRLFRSREQVRALLYMKKIDPGSIGTEPLDKLTRDIDLEIDELEKRY
ncbi:MAG: HNH endonuclease [Clostridia bacterium]|nr:HNH endonuclease [Clostridia bacterium]